MEVDTDELLVTSGGQQVIDLVCKTLLDPGDVVVAEAPTYPGAIPTFCSYQADVVQVPMDRDGMRVDELEQTLDELERTGRRPKFIYTVPNFHNPAGVTMSLERRRELVRIAGERELHRARGQPVRAAALRGRAAAAAALARRRVRDLRQHLLQDPLARRAAGLGGGAGADPGQDADRQAGLGPVLVLDLAVLRHRLLRLRAVGGLRPLAAGDLPPAARRDARRAGRALPARGRLDPPAGRPVHLGHACPTTSTPPTCWPGRCASTSPSCPAGPRSSTAAAGRRCA